MNSYRGLVVSIFFALFGLGACVPGQTVVGATNPTVASADPTTRPSLPTGIPPATFSPQALATRTAFGSTVAAADALYATETALLPECGSFNHYGDSPDGKWVILQCVNSGMGVYDRTDHTKAWYFSYYQLYGLPYENGNRLGHVSPVHWSDDGKSLFFVARRTGDGGCTLYNDGSALYRLDLSSGAYSLLIPPADVHPYGSFSFSNREAYVAYIARSPEQNAVLTLFDLQANSKTDIPLGNQFTEGGYLIWSADNRQVLFSARSSGECETMTYYLVLIDLMQHTRKIIREGNAAQFVPVKWDTEKQVVVQAIGTGDLFCMTLPSGEMRPYSGPKLTPSP